MRRLGIWVVIIAALVGVAFSALALQNYVRVHNEGLSSPSFCNISETVNCDTVAASSFSTLFGLPTAGLGLLFFTLQLLYGAWVSFQKDEARGPATLGFFLSIGGLATSLYFLYVMAVVLEIYCLTCLVMDAAVLLILLGWLVSRMPRPTLLTNRATMFPAGLACLVTFAIGGLFLMNLGMALEGTGRRPSDAMIAEALHAFEQHKQFTVTINPKEHPTWGAENPKVQILEFSDFQCPFCKEAAFRIKPYLAEFRHDVQLIFMNFPLDAACHEGMQHSLHKFGCLAAKATTCVNRLGHDFWKYHDAAFHNQERLSAEWFVEEAVAQGIDKDTFVACIDDPVTDAAVKRDIALGKELNVRGTPTVFLNGRQVAWQNKDFLRAAIRSAIRK
jgi:protein-disulfide isomerase/uncharacterized membrane protein